MPWRWKDNLPQKPTTDSTCAFPSVPAEWISSEERSAPNRLQDTQPHEADHGDAADPELVRLVKERQDSWQAVPVGGAMQVLCMQGQCTIVST